MVLKFHLILIDEVPSQIQFIIGKSLQGIEMFGIFLPLGVQTVSQKTLCLRL